MKILISIISIILLFACSTKRESENKIVESTSQNDTLDVANDTSQKEKEVVILERDELTLDSPVVISENEYRENPLKHPLLPFYLSYDEWKTIRCIISINEDSYWNKTMIGLIETSDSLRINLNNQDIYLKPDSLVKFKEGIWTNTYYNDSISVRLLSEFENGGILRHLTGKGKIELKINKKKYLESGYFVAEIK